MARTKGGNVRRASSAPLIGKNKRGEPVPLQTIPAQQQPEGQPPRPKDLGLPWEENALVEETSSRPKMPLLKVSTLTVKPIVNDEESSEKSVDDDVVVVFETASRRRTRASAAAMKTKREVAGFKEGKDKTDDHADLEESESVKKAKEKKKGKRPCSEKQKIDSMSKRRKGVNISEPTQEKA
ncbi:hypothetical protein LIER_33816 [Lithospermum erythrorhizon]|uniref:Uncharacterized protein n=1 Tax=Lithospermum erythrorhizon TaxID=34254 RepID=A0AAV3RXX6_LITER